MRNLEKNLKHILRLEDLRLWVNLYGVVRTVLGVAMAFLEGVMLLKSPPSLCRGVFRPPWSNRLILSFIIAKEALNVTHLVQLSSNRRIIISESAKSAELLSKQSTNIEYSVFFSANRVTERISRCMEVHSHFTYKAMQMVFFFHIGAGKDFQ